MSTVSGDDGNKGADNKDKNNEDNKDNQNNDNENAPSDNAAEKGFLARAWESSAMAPIRIPSKVVKWATSPIWWPLALTTRGLWQVNKPAATLFAATSLTACLSVAAYTGTYLTVAAGDAIVPYAQGINKGVPQKVREKGGFWPCKSWEVSLGQETIERNESGNVSNRFNVSVRRPVWDAFKFWDDSEPAVITKLKKASEKGEEVQVNYLQSQWSAQKFNKKADNPNTNTNERESYFQKPFACIQKSPYILDGEIIEIGKPKENSTRSNGINNLMLE